MASQDARQDRNRFPTVIGVAGTLGTANAGTEDLVQVGINPTTGAMFVQDLSGAAGTTNIQGSVTVIGGTINAGTFTSTGTNVNIVTGTLQASGTATGVGVVSNLTNGSVNILTGTIQSSGTSTGVGVVSNLTNGSINVLTGTLQSSGTTTGVGVVSSVTNLASGTLAAVTSVTNLVSGTLAALTSLTNMAAGTVTAVNNIVTGTLANSGTTTGVGVVSNLTNGSINILTGTTTLVSTVTTVSNLTNGSVNLLTGTVTRVSNVGTLESGTVQINPVPVPTILQFGTLGTAGGSFFGTLSGASGAGTKHYITGVDIVMQSGTADIRILAGTLIQGTGVLAAGQFIPGGGISKRINPAFPTGTNSELIYHFVGAGTAFITASYWKGV